MTPQFIKILVEVVGPFRTADEAADVAAEQREFGDVVVRFFHFGCEKRSSNFRGNWLQLVVGPQGVSCAGVAGHPRHLREASEAPLFKQGRSWSVSKFSIHVNLIQ